MCISCDTCKQYSQLLAEANDLIEKYQRRLLSLELILSQKVTKDDEVDTRI